MALLTTFATTPLTSFLYPPWYQKKLEAWKRGEIDWDTGEPTAGHGAGADMDVAKPAGDRVRRLLVYLRLDNMPAMLNLVSLFGKQSSSASRESVTSTDEKGGLHPETVNLGSSSKDVQAVRAHGFRLLHLTDRDSSVMTVSQVAEFTRNDPVVNIFRTVGQFLKVAVSGEVSIMPESRFAEALLSKSSDISSDLLLVPWSESGSLVDSQVSPADGGNNKLGSAYAAFAKSLLVSTDHNIGIFFSNGTVSPPGTESGFERSKLMRAYSFSDIHHDIPSIPVTNKSHHIFMPYFGGNDDRLALRLVLQLCEKQNATATVINFTSSTQSEAQHHDGDYFGFVSTQLPAAVASRVKFETSSASDTNEGLLNQSKSSIQVDSRDVTWHNLIIIGRRVAAKYTGSKTSVKVSDEVKECLGQSAAILIASGIKADLLVVQAKTAVS